MTLMDEELRNDEKEALAALRLATGLGRSEAKVIATAALLTHARETRKADVLFHIDAQLMEINTSLVMIRDALKNSGGPPTT